MLSNSRGRGVLLWRRFPSLLLSGSASSLGWAGADATGSIRQIRFFFRTTGRAAAAVTAVGLLGGQILLGGTKAEVEAAAASPLPSRSVFAPPGGVTALSPAWIRPGRTVGATVAGCHPMSRQTVPPIPVTVVHVIVLVHGWMGNAQELSYLQDSLQRHAANFITTSATDNETVVDFVVHSATCNEGRTFDGVAAGGHRLADEVRGILDALLLPSERGGGISDDRGEQVDGTTASSSRCLPSTITLSFVGNSLGGLYARAALPHLASYFASSDQPPQPQSSDGVTVIPAVFCTTATPHLGTAGHTGIPLPGWLERSVVAPAIGTTGRDLFRIEEPTPPLSLGRLPLPLLDQMVVDESFLQPLRAFHKRLAYANAHGTDFQVPTATASFVDPQSDSPHTIVWTRPNDDNRAGVGAALPLDGDNDGDGVVLVVETVPRVFAATGSPDEHSPLRRLSTAELSERLDALGWTKVFIDVRSLIPSIPIPWKATAQNDNDPNLEPSTIVSSRDLHYRYAAASSTAFSDGLRVHFPLGHTLLVANSKSAAYAKINAPGRPVVDAMAATLVRDIVRTVRERKDATNQETER